MDRFSTTSGLPNTQEANISTKTKDNDLKLEVLIKKIRKWRIFSSIILYLFIRRHAYKFKNNSKREDRVVGE